MKKIALIIFSMMLCIILTACGSGVRVDISVDDEASGSFNSSTDNGDSDGLETLTENIYIAYDRSEYENVTAPKCYYADYQKIEDDFLLDLFSGTPTFNEAAGMYSTDGEFGYNTYNGSKTGFYIMAYWTARGNDYDTVGNRSYEKYSTIEELDFMRRNEIKSSLESAISEIAATGIVFDAYAIKAENYSDNATSDSDTAPTKPNAPSYDKEWGEATDYYYIRARQMVDNIPIFTGRAGSSDTGSSSFGTQIKAVFTENGIEYLFINAPYKIIEEAQTHNDFVTLKKAEGIMKNKFENLLTFDPVTLETVELVYIPLHSENKLILTPVWEFSDDFGPLYRINAYTGEEII